MHALQNRVNHAGGGEEGERDCVHQNPRNEVWQCGQRLNKIAEPLGADLIQSNGEQQWEERSQDAQAGNTERIEQNLTDGLELRWIGPQHGEPLETNEL